MCSLCTVAQDFAGQQSRRNLRAVNLIHLKIKFTEDIHNGKIYLRSEQIHLAEVDSRATEMLDRLVKQMAEKQGITEQLKAQNQVAWVGAMNNIRNAAEEIILQELIYEEDVA